MGTLIGIARRAGRRAPMEELSSGLITIEAGLAGDSRGAKFRLPIPELFVTNAPVSAFSIITAIIKHPRERYICARGACKFFCSYSAAYFFSGRRIHTFSTMPTAIMFVSRLDPP